MGKRLWWLNPRRVTRLGLALFFAGSVLPAAAQTLVLAFEHTLAPASGLDSLARSKMLIKNLKTGGVEQAAFFVQENAINAHTINVLDFYETTGQLLVNVGSKYHYLKRDTGYGLPIDMLKADASLSAYSHYKGFVYIKHLPFEGDGEKQQKIADFLREHLYQPVFVTTPIQDGFLNKVVQARLAANKSLDTRALERVYTAFVKEQIDRKAAQLQFWFGFQPTQVVLLQENDVAAYGVLGLIDSLTEAGYRIINAEQGITDPIANPYRLNGYRQATFFKYLSGVESATDVQPLVWSGADEKRLRELISAEHVEYWYQTSAE